MQHESVMPTDQDIAFFNECGYWVSPQVISDERIAEIVQRMEKLYAGEYETGRAPFSAWLNGDNPRAIRKTDNSHWADTVLYALATDVRIGAIASKLMQTDLIRLWHDQMLYKPGRGPGKGTANVGWHQDYSYWQCAATPSLVTAWVALTDVDLSNGCMQMVPYSHRWGLVNVNDFFEQDMQKQQEMMQVPEGYSFEPVPIVMKAGQVSFHHALTIHGSGANRTEEPRRSMAIHLMTGDTRYRAGTKGDAHMNVGLLNGNDGDLFAGEPFPVLFSSDKGMA